jgi:D-3-phosphoglycerate dehydrogenase
MLARDLYPQVEATKDGAWKRGQNRSELSGKTVGFVGYGRIARRVAALLEPFDVPTLGFDPFVDKSPDRTKLVDLPELLGSSDYVSLHAAATGANTHLLDRARFAQMKRGACLVNVARGPLVDESALLEALDSGHLAGAALDVFEQEPPADARLLAHPKVIATPHIGASTQEAQQRAGRQVVEEVLRALAGKPLLAEVRAGAGP